VTGGREEDAPSFGAFGAEVDGGIAAAGTKQPIELIAK
jgi:hypothetical protein